MSKWIQLPEGLVQKLRPFSERQVLRKVMVIMDRQILLPYLDYRLSVDIWGLEIDRTAPPGHVLTIFVPTIDERWYLKDGDWSRM